MRKDWGRDGLQKSSRLLRSMLLRERILSLSGEVRTIGENKVVVKKLQVIRLDLIVAFLQKGRLANRIIAK